MADLFQWPLVCFYSFLFYLVYFGLVCFIYKNFIFNGHVLEKSVPKSVPVPFPEI